MLRERMSKPDYMLALTVFLLSLFGIVMIYSASTVVAQESFGSSYYFALHQIRSLLIGLGLMIGVYFIDYRFWRKIALPLFLANIILLLAVYLPGIGKSFGGAHRWIGIGSFIFQPSELVKLTFLIYFASWLEKKGGQVRNFASGFLPFIVLMIVLGVLIMGQPDLGTLSVIAITAVIIYFISGARYKHIAAIVAGAIVLFFILIKIEPYRMQRFLVFLNPSNQTLGAAYHINQALLAIGSGGLWGLGFGQSKQKYLYLPQAHTDSIFAIIAEELGFLRVSLILAVYVFIAWRGFKIAREAPDNFAKFLAAGITIWIIIQALINISAMLNIIPLTGVPLPFISYGGSSLIINLVAIGILLNISKYSRQDIQGGQ